MHTHNHTPRCNRRSNQGIDQHDQCHVEKIVVEQVGQSLRMNGIAFDCVDKTWKHIIISEVWQNTKLFVSNFELGRCLNFDQK